MSYGNGIKLTAGFDVGAKTPLDSKSVVQTIAERDAFVTDNLVYEGLEVYVKDTGHKYRYNGTSWIDLDAQSGSESGTGEGLTTEQAEQLQTAYEHSQSTHVTSDDLLNIDAVSLNGKRFSEPMTKQEYDAIIDKDPNTIYLIESDNAIEGIPSYTSSDANKVLAVNSDGNALAWVNAPSGSGSGIGLTTEQANQLTAAYNHSQSPHIQISNIPTKTSQLENDSDYLKSTDTIDADSLNGKRFSKPMTKQEYDAIVDKDDNTIYLVDDDSSIEGLPSYTIGDANKVLTVNNYGTGLAWKDQSNSGSGGSSGSSVTTETTFKSFSLKNGENKLDATVQDCIANISYTKGIAVSGDIHFTNLLANSDTFESPSGYSLIWQAYKCTKEVQSSGTVKITGNAGDGSVGIFQYNQGSYYTSSGLSPQSEDHVFYVKYKKSADGITYTLASSYYDASNVFHPVSGTGAIIKLTPADGETVYVKDAIMIDLTDIYGAGNEPDKSTCDTTYGDLWSATNYGVSGEMNNNFLIQSYDGTGSVIDSLDTSTDTSKTTLELKNNGSVKITINDVEPSNVTISNVKCLVTILSGGGSSTKRIDLSNVDRLLFLGDSYTEGMYYQKGKSWTCQLSEQLDYTCEGYGWGGYTSETLAENIQNNLSRYNSVPIKSLNPSKVMLMTFVNDMVKMNYDNTQYLNGMKNLIKEVEYLGAKPIICTEFRDPWGYGLQQNLSILCQQNGYEFFNILPYTKFLGITTATDDDSVSAYYIGSHPAQRTGGIILNQYLRYCKNLPRPISAIKIYRKRNGVEVSNINDLLFSNRRDKLLNFKEILISHSALSDETDWDSLDNLKGTVQNGVNSEYGKLIANENVGFNDYALVEVILPSFKNNIKSAKLVISDSSVLIYVKKQDGFVQISDGIVDDLVNSIEYDKLTFLLYKDGGFTLNDIYLEWEGEERPKFDSPKFEIYPSNPTELLPNNTFETNTDWYTTIGTVNVTEPTNYKPMPTGCTKLITVDNNNYINLTKTFTNSTVAASPTKVRLRIVARYNPTKGSTEINGNSYDRKQLKLEFKGTTIGTDVHRYTQYAEVDMSWNMIEFDLSDSEALDVNILSSDDTAIEICYISLIKY